MLRPEKPAAERGRFYRWSEGFFEWMIRGYDRGLKWVLDHQRLTLMATLATVALTGLLAIVIPKASSRSRTRASSSASRRPRPTCRSSA